MWRAFHKLYLGWLLRPEPLDFPHDFFRDSVLMLTFSFWQVHEWHLFRFQILQSFEYLRAVELV